MYVIEEDLDHIPGNFQAQIKHRCQFQYIKSDKKDKDKKPDAQIWAEKWQKSCKDIKRDRQNLSDSPVQQSRRYQFAWRFVTNGGQDDRIIRPVIGAGGLPYYPGSSMKGAFRHACTPDQVARYCGQEENSPAEIPLRFLGGYPTNANWHEKLLDLTHPQQDWQVKTNDTSDRKSHGAYALISLYQPEFRFTISSPMALESEQWQEIWDIWQVAVAEGLGCRVSAGYGQAHLPAEPPLYKVHLKGQGYAATLLDGIPEFRPNIFRAALRGHALRLFGGLTNAIDAQAIVGELFGETNQGSEPTVGLLKMYWEMTKAPWSEEKPKIQAYRTQQAEPTEKGNRHYDIEGTLRWYLVSNQLTANERQLLGQVVQALTQFAMLLGGFGKSWRRPDHTLFYHNSYNRPIGCHWQWRSSSLFTENPVWYFKDIKSFLDQVSQTMQQWLTVKGFTIQDPANWREAWHQDNVQVWGRRVTPDDDWLAIDWLHGAYQSSRSIKNQSLTGQMGQVGRLWYRIYPMLDRESGEETEHEWELLTLFPDPSDAETRKFLQFLATNQSHGFTKLWGN